MDHLNLKELAAWLTTCNIDELVLTSPQGQVRLRRGEAAATPSPVPTHGPGPAPSGGTEPSGSRVVKTPGLGIFLQAHPLRGSPFAQVGERVKQGQCLGLLQVGSLLRPVPAPCDGLMATYTLASGSTVGYGTPVLTLQTN